MKKIKVAVMVIGILLASHFNMALGHHSHASLDDNDVRIVSGLVTRYSWSYPHVYLKVEAPNPSGNVVEYSIELLHPGGMSARGWNKDTFKTGDRITWEGRHDRNKSRAYAGLEWAERNGVRVGQDMAGNDQQIIPSSDFTGMWNRGPNQFTYSPPPGWPLTEFGQALVDGFSEDQNPILECDDPGPPKSMILPYTHLIRYQDEKTLIIERDMMIGHRVIHLNQDTEQSPPSKFGHSVGRFENGDLIIETSGFTPDSWGTHTGIDSSEQKHLRERMRLVDDGLGVEIDITVTDPTYLSEPKTFIHRWIKAIDREVIRAPCTLESAKLFIEAGYGDEE